jgi:hypothetical protein
MSLDSTKEVGKIIGNTISELDNTKANLTASDSSSQFNFEFNDNLKINGNIKIYKLEYDTTSFIIDHPVQGYIDTGYLFPNYLISGYLLENNTNDKISTNNLTSNSVTYATSPYGYSISCPTSTSYLKTPLLNTYTNSVLSVSCWFYFVPYSTTGQLLRVPNTQVYALNNNIVVQHGVGVGFKSLSTGWHFIYT